MRGFLLGALALTALDLVLSSPVERTGGLFTAVTKWLQEWMSPDVPLIPDRGGGGAVAPPNPFPGVNPRQGLCPPGYVRAGVDGCVPAGKHLTGASGA